MLLLAVESNFLFHCLKFTENHRVQNELRFRIKFGPWASDCGTVPEIKRLDARNNEKGNEIVKWCLVVFQYSSADSPAARDHVKKKHTAYSQSIALGACSSGIFFVTKSHLQNIPVKRRLRAGFLYTLLNCNRTVEK